MARWVIWLVALGLLAGCGASKDGWPEGRPQILHLEYLQQSPQDPYALQFSLEFRDTDADLGGGTLHMLLDDEEAAVQPMSELFAAQTPPIEPQAAEGELEVVVRVQSKVAVGEELKIQFRLVDAAGQESNDPWVQVKALAPGGGL